MPPNRHVLPEFLLDRVENSGFRICGWWTNDANHDLTHKALVEFCVLVVKKAGFKVTSAAYSVPQPDSLSQAG